MQAENQIVKVLTAAQVNALDSTSQTLATLRTAATVVRVPLRLVLVKAAGTAYTVGSGCRLEIKDTNGELLFSVPAEGFLDQTTQEARVVTAAPVARKNDSETTFVLSATAALSSGTGSVSVKMFFFEEPVNL